MQLFILKNLEIGRIQFNLQKIKFDNFLHICIGLTKGERHRETYIVFINGVTKFHIQIIYRNSSRAINETTKQAHKITYK